MHFHKEVNSFFLCQQKENRRRRCKLIGLLTHQSDISKPASCLEPIRSNAFPSSKAFPIVSSHHCPIALPSRPTYNCDIGSKCKNRIHITRDKLFLRLTCSIRSNTHGLYFKKKRRRKTGTRRKELVLAMVATSRKHCNVTVAV